MRFNHAKSCGRVASVRPARGHGRRLDTMEHQREEKRRHRRPFGVVQPERVAKALRRPRRGDEATLAVPPHQVLEDGPGLGEHEVAIGDHRGLAERVHRAKLRRREHRSCVALVALHFVLEAELLEEPEDALRAGVIEMMEDDHGGLGRCRGLDSRRGRTLPEGAARRGRSFADIVRPSMVCRVRLERWAW